jgi:hypothetical protein
VKIMVLLGVRLWFGVGHGWDWCLGNLGWLKGRGHGLDIDWWW